MVAPLLTLRLLCARAVEPIDVPKAGAGPEEIPAAVPVPIEDEYVPIRYARPVLLALCNRDERLESMPDL